LVADQPDMGLVGEASNGCEAIDEFRKHHPDVTLLDLQMPEMNGIGAILAIRGKFPEARIVVLTTYTGDTQVIHRYVVLLRLALGQWGRLWPVHNGVVGVAGQRPETQRTSREVGTGMAAHGRFGNKHASVVNRLFYAVGGVFAVTGNVTPEVKNIRFGKRRESTNAHRLDKRQSSFIAWISRPA